MEQRDVYTIMGFSANQVLSEGIRYLLMHGCKEASRNGPVLALPGPAVIHYPKPERRVLMGAVRDANPFFHFMEGLWMLAGADDVAFVKQFNTNISQYSDDGLTFHGAYGARWRRSFGFDQLQRVQEALLRDPASRRAVLAMWAPARDLPEGSAGLDIPCNTHIYFRVQDNALNMTVCNRSNDAIWGAFGANLVHMSMLHEYMAAAVGRPIGNYWQISNNLHAYLEKYPISILEQLMNEADIDDPYRGTPQATFPLITEPPEVFLRDVTRWVLVNGRAETHSPLLTHVAAPMLSAWRAHKAGKRPEALAQAARIAAWDWRAACLAWLQRRYAAPATTLPGAA